MSSSEFFRTAIGTEQNLSLAYSILKFWCSVHQNKNEMR